MELRAQRMMFYLLTLSQSTTSFRWKNEKNLEKAVSPGKLKAHAIHLLIPIHFPE
jgi:hypothetical protein